MTREDRAEAQLGLRRETGWFSTFIQVETGHGILSAIDVSMTMEREANSKGDRVTMNLSGRFSCPATRKACLIKAPRSRRTASPALRSAPNGAIRTGSAARSVRPPRRAPPSRPPG